MQRRCLLTERNAFTRPSSMPTSQRHRDDYGAFDELCKRDAKTSHQSLSIEYGVMIMDTHNHPKVTASLGFPQCISSSRADMVLCIHQKAT